MLWLLPLLTLIGMLLHHHHIFSCIHCNCTLQEMKRLTSELAFNEHALSEARREALQSARELQAAKAQAEAQSASAAAAEAAAATAQRQLSEVERACMLSAAVITKAMFVHTPLFCVQSRAHKSSSPD